LNYLQVYPTCIVELRSIGQYKLPIFVRHNRIIFINKNGIKTVFEGNPAGNPLLAKKLDMCEQYSYWPPGQLIVNSYMADLSDEEGYDPPDLIVEGDGICDNYACFMQQKDQINSKCLQYGYLYPNSNSVAYTLLHSCGLETPDPKYSIGWSPIL
jgi:hypothetical protein